MFPLNCRTGSLRRDGERVVYGFVAKVRAGAYPLQGENSTGVIPSENNTLPLPMPNRASLVQCAFQAERTAATAVQNSSRCPAFTVDPSTVPVPGKIGIMPLMPSGKSR